MSQAAGMISGVRIPQIRRDTSHYLVELTSSWDDVAARLRADMLHAHKTPFQHWHWLGAWYDAHRHDRNNAPLIAIVRDPRQHDVLAIIPLIVRYQHGARIAEFAGGADYNAPILGSAAADHPIDPALLWASLQQALSAAGGCDVVRFSKMPSVIGDLPNPLASLALARPCAIEGHQLIIDDDYEAHRLGRERTFRKELERSWRVFTKHEGARFERITDMARALHVFATLEMQQSERMRGLGQDYALDDKDSSAFHRDVIGRGLDEGYVVLTALTCGETIVATLLGICIEATYLMVRISNAGGIWTNCSPGRLIIDRTMAALHHDGIRKFDFSVGSYDYKRRFGVTPLPLYDLVAAVNWRGRVMLAADRIVKSWQARVAALKPQT
ncbi:GNAT family N-acetyltransferase [Tardiphaga alba]|nr:GNAT family N-acetyltransferase [Tardiphaga alba]